MVSLLTGQYESLLWLLFTRSTELNSGVVFPDLRILKDALKRFLESVLEIKTLNYKIIQIITERFLEFFFDKSYRPFERKKYLGIHTFYFKLKALKKHSWQIWSTDLNKD